MPKILIVAPNSGTTDAVFTVTLSPPNVEQRVRVNFATADGTALANQDYLPESGTLTFDFGQTTQLRFTDLLRNPKVDPADFRFTPPKGADVLGEP